MRCLMSVALVLQAQVLPLLPVSQPLDLVQVRVQALLELVWLRTPVREALHRVPVRCLVPG